MPDRVEGTCTWFLHHERYLEWCSTLQNDVLWLSGGPGFGKSVLSKALVDDVLGAQGPAGTVLYYFFRDTSTLR